MATNACNVNQLESDSHLPPRKRLLARFKKQNLKIVNNGSPSFASSSSTTTSNGSSSVSTDVLTHLDNILNSQLINQSQSLEELAHSAKALSAFARKAAKAARANANEKAMIASKAKAEAKSALELVASFPVEVVGSKERSPWKNK